MNTMYDFERSTAYWVDGHANIISVPIGQEHIDVSRSRLGDKSNPYRAGWIRVVIDGDFGIMFDYGDSPSPQQMLSLREIATEHGLALFDAVKRRIVEFRRSSVRHHALELAAQLIAA